MSKSNCSRYPSKQYKIRHLQGRNPALAQTEFTLPDIKWLHDAAAVQRQIRAFAGAEGGPVTYVIYIYRYI